MDDRINSYREACVCYKKAKGEHEGAWEACKHDQMQGKPGDESRVQTSKDELDEAKAAVGKATAGAVIAVNEAGQDATLITRFSRVVAGGSSYEFALQWPGVQDVLGTADIWLTHAGSDLISRESLLGQMDISTSRLSQLIRSEGFPKPIGSTKKQKFNIESVNKWRFDRNEPQLMV